MEKAMAQETFTENLISEDREKLAARSYEDEGTNTSLVDILWGF
jgi:hypothetical protein